MALAQKQKSKTVNAEESMTLVRNLLRTCVSTICYLRGVFSESHFMDRTVSGVPIKSLSPADDQSKLLLDWLEKGVFDALRLKYLKVLSFGFYTDKDEQSIIESYEFKVTYDTDTHLNLSRKGPDGEILEHSKAEITANMKNMLRTLIALVSTLKPLPDSRYITMKLLYYEDVTPPEYQPKYFVEVDDHAKELFRQRQLCKLHIGSLATKFLGFDARIAALPDWFNEDLTAAGELLEDTAHSSEDVSEDSGVEIIHRKTAELSMGPKPAASSGGRAPNQVGTTTVTASAASGIGATTDERRVFQILAQGTPSEADLLYLRGVLHVLESDVVVPTKFGKRVGIDGYAVKDLLDDLQADGFTKQAANKRSRVPVLNAENRAAVEAILRAPCAAALAPEETRLLLKEAFQRASSDLTVPDASQQKHKRKQSDAPDVPSSQANVTHVSGVGTPVRQFKRARG